MNDAAGPGGWKVPERQQVSPDVEGLIGHLKKAEDTGSGRTLWMSVAEEDALFMEHLYGEKQGHGGETSGSGGKVSERTSLVAYFFSQAVHLNT